MKYLPIIKDYKQYSDLIVKKIEEYFNDVLFNVLEEINSETVMNGKGLQTALLTGKIVYDKGRFKGKFNNALSAELEGLGAKFDKISKSYVLELNSIPADIQQAIAQVRIKDQDKYKKMMSYFYDLQERYEFLEANVDFDREITIIGKSLNGQFAKSMKAVNTVPMEMTDYQLKEIAKNYTNNLDKYITKWTEEETAKLREGIIKLVEKGYNSHEVEKYILKQKSVGLRKAKFLARNETSLLVAEYTKNRFIQEGVTMYRWSAVMDSRTRSWHRHLDGKIFSFDNPPIIDQTTGDRGNPAETYNCRCKAIPVVTDAFWKEKKASI